MPWAAVSPGSGSWSAVSATGETWTAPGPATMPWRQPVVSAASADGGQDFQFAFRARGSETFTASRPFLLTNSTLSEGTP